MRLNGLTYLNIGKQAGISRQRVQQLLSPPPVIRRMVVAKANGECQYCGLTVGQSGHVHHNGDAFDTYDDIENLELLCISCHRKAHHMKDEAADLMRTRTHIEINMTTNDLMRVAQAAEGLGKPRLTIYRLIKRGRITAIRFGGILYIPVSEIERLKKGIKQ